MSSDRGRPPASAVGALALGLAVLVGVAGSAGVLVAAKDTSEDVDTGLAGDPRGPRSAVERRPCRELPARRLATRARASTRPTPTPAAIGDADGRRRQAQRHDHGAAPRARRRRLAVQPAPRPVGADRRHRPLGQDQLGVQRGPAPARRHRHRVARASRSTTTWRSTSTGSRRSSTPSAVSRCARRTPPRTQLRPATRPRLHHARRVDGAGVRPQPALPGVDRRRLGRGTGEPTSAASSASSSSSARR